MKTPETLTLHPVSQKDLTALSKLCLRSKAYWGYDEAFMKACQTALTLTKADLDGLPIVMAKSGALPAGLAQLGRKGGDLEIDRLFVDPPFIGTGCGRILVEWCRREAKALGAPRLLIEADPGAAPFYEKMGAVQIGTAPSEVLKDRALPLLELRL